MHGTALPGAEDYHAFKVAKRCAIVFLRIEGKSKMKIMPSAAFAALLIIAPTSQALAQTQFPTEQQAQQHCPSDTVVWVNLPTGIYHFKGERWYGRTKSGAFVCQKEADQAGDRATRNGQ